MTSLAKIFLLFLCVVCISCAQKTPISSQAGANSVTNSCGGMNAQACETYNSINAVRIQNGVPALALRSNCVRMAQDHAEDMVRRGFFSHDSPTETFSQRVSRYSLSGGYVGENIAIAGSPTDAVQAWMGSTNHRSNILNTVYVSTGLGYYDGHYVQCFTSFSGDVTVTELEARNE